MPPYYSHRHCPPTPIVLTSRSIRYKATNYKSVTSVLNHRTFDLQADSTHPLMQATINKKKVGRLRWWVGRYLGMQARFSWSR